MFRLFFRFIGLMSLAAGFAALVVDGTRSIASNALILTPLSQTFIQVAPLKFLALKASVSRHFGPSFWNALTSLPFALPTWLVLGAIGALLLLATRKRRRMIGFSSR